MYELSLSGNIYEMDEYKEAISLLRLVTVKMFRCFITVHYT